MKPLADGHFNILLSRDEKEVLAHCLDFNLMADGKTADEALNELSKMMHEYMSFYLSTNKLHDIYDPAPQEYWDRIKYLMEQGKQPKKVVFLLPQVPVETIQSPSPTIIRKYMHVVQPLSFATAH
jgi:hypothetical protein